MNISLSVRENVIMRDTRKLLSVRGDDEVVTHNAYSLVRRRSYTEDRAMILLNRRLREAFLQVADIY